MIDKIDTDEIMKGTMCQIGDCTKVAMKVTPYEKSCIDKINELVDKFNDVFPL